MIAKTPYWSIEYRLQIDRILNGLQNKKDMRENKILLHTPIFVRFAYYGFYAVLVAIIIFKKKKKTEWEMKNFS